MTQRNKERRRPGRKPRPLPPMIDASPEAVAHMLVTTPPKKEWEWEYPEKYGNDADRS